MVRTKRKEMPTNVYYPITIFLTFISTIVFFLPLAVGLLIYFTFNGLGVECAKHFANNAGYKPEGSIFSIASFYSSVYRIAGLGILTFLPSTAYSLVFVVGAILSHFDIGFGNKEDYLRIALCIAIFFSIGTGVLYWCGINQHVYQGTTITIMKIIEDHIHQTYKVVLYAFPMITMIILGIVFLFLFVWLNFLILKMCL